MGQDRDSDVKKRRDSGIKRKTIRKAGFENPIVTLFQNIMQTKLTRTTEFDYPGSTTGSPNSR